MAGSQARPRAPWCGSGGGTSAVTADGRHLRPHLGSGATSTGRAALQPPGAAGHLPDRGARRVHVHHGNRTTTPTGADESGNLIEAAQDRRRAGNGPHPPALVGAGATPVNGEFERPDDDCHQPGAARGYSAAIAP